MELNMKEPRDKEELHQMIHSVPEDVSIIIENNILSIDGKWLLRKKGEKLENINHILEQNHKSQNFRSELRKQIESFAGRWDVDIKRLLYAKLDEPKSTEKKPCLTLSYLSILETGNSADIESWKEAGFIWQDIKKVDRTQLTPSTSYTYGVIRQNGQEIQNVLKTYKEFSTKFFNKYCLYGMENRHEVLEGIMYYTNRHLTNNYLQLREEEQIPSTEEKIEIWKQKVAKKYEQLYRFVYMLDGEPTRFDYHLRPEEKETVNQTIESTLQKISDEKILLFFNRGIFFDDRKLQQDVQKGWTFDKIKGYIWTGEVYDLMQQLEFIEKTDPLQYYSRWLQAKISRLEISSQYSKEGLEELKKVYIKYLEEKEKKESKHEIAE